MRKAMQCVVVVLFCSIGWLPSAAKPSKEQKKAVEESLKGRYKVTRMYGVGIKLLQALSEDTDSRPSKQRKTTTDSDRGGIKEAGDVFVVNKEGLYASSDEDYASRNAVIIRNGQAIELPGRKEVFPEKGDRFYLTKIKVQDDGIRFDWLSQKQVPVFAVKGGQESRQRVCMITVFDLRGDLSLIAEAKTDEIAGLVEQWLMPEKKVVAAAEKAKNVSLEVGMSEEQIVVQLGKPNKTIQVGAKKYMKYPDMTITVEGGKATDIKVE